MTRVLRTAVTFVASSVLIWAQTQVGTVTSSASFRLRGATISPGQGVPSWPVLPGDVVKAGNAQTIVTLADGSVISLEPGAEGNFDLTGDKPQFQLVSGTVNYTLKSPTSANLLSGDKTITPTGLSGSYSRNGQANKPVGFWTPAHTALVVAGVGGATAAALGVGVASANSAGKQVSPSH